MTVWIHKKTAELIIVIHIIFVWDKLCLAYSANKDRNFLLSGSELLAEFEEVGEL